MRNHQPVGAVTNVATGPTAWLSAQALAEWRLRDRLGCERDLVSRLAQNFDANGVAERIDYVPSTTPQRGHRLHQPRVRSGTVDDKSVLGKRDGAASRRRLRRREHVLRHYQRDISLPFVSVQRFDAAGNEAWAGLRAIRIPNPMERLQRSHPWPTAATRSAMSTTDRPVVFLTVLRFRSRMAPCWVRLYHLWSPVGPRRLRTTTSRRGLPNGGRGRGLDACSADDQCMSASTTRPGSRSRRASSGRTRPRRTPPRSMSFSDGDYVVSWRSVEGVEYADIHTAGSPVPPADNDLIATIAPDIHATGRAARRDADPQWGAIGHRKRCSTTSSRRTISSRR